MIRDFMLNAMRNALAANDLSIYDRAFQMLAGNLGSEQAVRNLQLPTPKMLGRMLKVPLAFTFDISELATGMYIAEWALEHPDQAGGITWNYFSPLAQSVAHDQIVLGPLQ